MNLPAPGRGWRFMAAPDAAQITRWQRYRPFEDVQSALGPAPRQRAPGRRRHPPAIARHTLAVFVAVSVALVLQASVFPHLAVRGVVPDLVLLVVVAVGLAHGSEQGLVLGFGAGLLLDLAPPADHYAGRWALALLVVGYVAGRLSSSGRTRVGEWLPVAAACAFVGTSVFALTGLLLRDPAVGVGELLRVEVVAVCSDVVLALLVVPLTLGLFAKVEPDRVAA